MRLLGTSIGSQVFCSYVNSLRYTNRHISVWVEEVEVPKGIGIGNLIVASAKLAERDPRWAKDRFAKATSKFIESVKRLMIKGNEEVKKCPYQSLPGKPKQY